MPANFQLQCEMFKTYSVGPHLEINVKKLIDSRRKIKQTYRKSRKLF